MLRTRICDLLGVELPIISAPMGGSAGADLAAAVSEAGGFGMIGGTSAGGADWLRAQIRAVQARTDRPFGVGFISSYPNTDELVEVALEERVRFMSHSFADPTPWIEPAHREGVTVLVQVQSVAQAIAAARAGADLIAAQGIEAGGHGGEVSATLPLVPAVIDAIRDIADIPVVAAGGIADGRGLAACLMLGAEGVWMGTRFVVSAEWAGSDWARQRAVAAGTDDTVQTRAYDLANGSPFPGWVRDRVIANSFTTAWTGREGELLAAREEQRARLAAAAREGNTDVAPVRVGNAVGLVHDVEPAGEIVRRVVAEAERILRERPGRLLIS